MKSFSGWADSLCGNNAVKYPIQMALYDVKGDCDWDLEIDTLGDYVNKEYSIGVVAQRYCTQGWSYKVATGTIEICTFSFTVPSYTLSNVYEYAKKALKSARIRKFRY